MYKLNINMGRTVSYMIYTQHKQIVTIADHNAHNVHTNVSGPKKGSTTSYEHGCSYPTTCQK